jgi:hypothetical protein
LTGCNSSPTQQQEFPFVFDARVNRIEASTGVTYNTVLSATLPLQSDTNSSRLDSVSFDGHPLQYQSSGRFSLLLPGDSADIPFKGESHRWRVARHGEPSWTADVTALNQPTMLLTPAQGETLQVSKPVVVAWNAQTSPAPVSTVYVEWLVLDSAQVPLGAGTVFGGGDAVTSYTLQQNWASANIPSAPIPGTIELTRSSSENVQRNGHPYALRLASSVWRDVVIAP